MADPTWSTGTQITADVGIRDHYAHLMVEADGYISVVYLHSLSPPASDEHLYVKQGYTAAELLAATAVRADTQAGNVDGYNGSSGAITTNGKIHAVWSQANAGVSGADIWYASKARGAAWTTPENVTSLPLLTDVASNPSISVDNTGRQFVTFSRNTGPTTIRTRAKIGGVWTNEITWPGGYKTGSNTTTAKNGDILVTYTTDDAAVSGRPAIKVRRLKFQNPQLDPTVAGNWDTLGTWESATYLIAVNDGLFPVISALNRNDFLLTFDGQDATKYYTIAAWTINGLSSPVLAGMTGNATILGSRNIGIGIEEYRTKNAISSARTGIAVEQYCVADAANPGASPYYQRYWLLKGNVWSAVKQGVREPTNSILTEFPDVKFRPNSGRVWITWQNPD